MQGFRVFWRKEIVYHFNWKYSCKQYFQKLFYSNVFLKCQPNFLFEVHNVCCCTWNPLSNPTCDLPTCSVCMLSKLLSFDVILHKYSPLSERRRSFRVREVTWVYRLFFHEIWSWLISVSCEELLKQARSKGLPFSTLDQVTVKSWFGGKSCFQVYMRVKRFHFPFYEEHLTRG